MEASSAFRRQMKYCCMLQHCLDLAPSPVFAGVEHETQALWETAAELVPMT
jgi:hypothetical protein